MLLRDDGVVAATETAALTPTHSRPRSSGGFHSIIMSPANVRIDASFSSPVSTGPSSAPAVVPIGWGDTSTAFPSGGDASDKVAGGNGSTGDGATPTVSGSATRVGVGVHLTPMPSSTAASPSKMAQFRPGSAGVLSGHRGKGTAKSKSWNVHGGIVHPNVGHAGSGVP